MKLHIIKKKNVLTSLVSDLRHSINPGLFFHFIPENLETFFLEKARFLDGAGESFIKKNYNGLRFELNLT